MSEGISRKKHHDIKRCITLIIAATVSTVSAARAEAKEDIVSIVDRSGKTIIEPVYTNISFAAGTREGTATIFKCFAADGRIDFRNYTGKLVPVPNFPNVKTVDILLPNSFVAPDDQPIKALPEGTLLEVMETDHLGLYDLSGHAILKPEYQNISWLVSTGVKGLRFAILNQQQVNTHTLFDLQCKRVYELPSSERVEFDVITNGNSQVLYKTATHKNFPSTERPLLTCTDYSDGALLFLVEGKHESGWGYLDDKANVILEPKFSSLSKLTNGIAVASPPGSSKRFYIDKNGSRISPEFDFASEMQDERAVVGNYRNGAIAQGIIDKNFHLLCALQYTGLLRMSSDLFIGRRLSDSSFVVLDRNGGEPFALPLRAAFVQFNGEHTIVCRIGGQPGFNEKGESLPWIIVDDHGKELCKLEAIDAYPEEDYDIRITVANKRDPQGEPLHGLVTREGKTIFPCERQYIQRLMDDRYERTVWK